MNVFVIIVTYKGKRWYQQCFDSLRTSEISIQTIVVDNASNDGTVEYIRENYPEIVLIESDKNLGFGQGNNLGIKHALSENADYVFLLNQDAWIYPNTISELVRIQRENDKFGILSPIHLEVNSNDILNGFLKIINRNGNIDSTWINDLYFSQIKDVYLAKSLPAASWLIPRETIAVLGGFDPLFFHRGEDDNYLQRAHYNDISIGFCPKIQIRHDSYYSDVDKYLELNRYNERLVLLEASNITSVSCNWILISSIKRMFVNVLFLKFRNLLLDINKVKTILMNYQKITNSRSVNKLKGSNWLS